MTHEQLYKKLQSLAIFRRILDDTTVNALCKYLSCRGESDEKLSLYSEFIYTVYSCDEDTFAKHIKNIVNDSENPYIRFVGMGKNPSKEFSESLERELVVLQELSEITADFLRGNNSFEVETASFSFEQLDIRGEYLHRIQNIGVYGYGMYSKYRMFCLDGNNHIVPVKNPDTVDISSLIDYKREQKIIIDNTVALLEGKPAANILLTGDAGTGKSSTVKAVVNMLYDRGLRILEVRKDQFSALPHILDELSLNPLKFIIFADDLSFNKDDDNFSALKAILEGSVSAKSKNVVIYATSNRRHLVKETFSSREGDEIHINDTVQEILSLSARFGIRVSFYKPDKKTYLHIVSCLAEENGITIPTEELFIQAERFALENGGRSPRAANQFIDSLISVN